MYIFVINKTFYKTFPEKKMSLVFNFSYAHIYSPFDYIYYFYSFSYNYLFTI